MRMQQSDIKKYVRQDVEVRHISGWGWRRDSAGVVDFARGRLMQVGDVHYTVRFPDGTELPKIHYMRIVAIDPLNGND